MPQTTTAPQRRRGRRYSSVPSVWAMDGQWAVVVGAALGASGAVVGALTTWASTRLQTRSHLDIAQLQHESTQNLDTVERKRDASADLVLAVDAVRRQMRAVRQHIEETPGTDVDFNLERVAVHERIREAQAAEWILRLMLASDEQESVTSLMDAMYTSHDALIKDGDDWVAQGGEGAARPPGSVARYAATTPALQAQMMQFAQLTHARLYSPALGFTARRRPVDPRE